MTLPSKTIVVTGFEPYGGRRVNPAAEVAKALDGSTVDEFAVIGAILPVSQRGLGERLEALLAELRPAIVISLGLAPGEPMIRLERFGLNLLDFEIADNDGARLADAPVEANGSTALRASLPLRAIERALLEAGIPARLSSTAGTFLCNATLYSLIRILEERFPASLGGFIHLPYLPEQVAQLLVEGKRERRLELAQRSDVASMDLATQIRAVTIAMREAVGALTARC
ncbi:MAG TPA: pyroglutamyl-peptidase I [Stellaceae bacterium]|nr:pyroglutamyl-peptidase I [Stellaceae bacterium]